MLTESDSLGGRFFIVYRMFYVDIHCYIENIGTRYGIIKDNL